MSDLVLELVLDEPTKVIWSMWTDPAEFVHWYGPSGAEIEVLAMDLRTGGARHVKMSMGGMDMYFVGEHLEVVPEVRLVYTESMADASGNVLTAADVGMPGDYPPTTTVTVELSLADGKTTMRLTHAGVAHDSPGASGWGMAFAKLRAHLA